MASSSISCVLTLYQYSVTSPPHCVGPQTRNVGVSHADPAALCYLRLLPALYDQSMPSLASTAPIGTLTPGIISPERAVPASIPRPEYVGKKAPSKFTGSEVKSAETIE